MKELKLKQLKSFSVENCFPVGDCTTCGRKRVPFAYTNTTPPIGYCLNCHNAVENTKARGYVSLVDLEESEWDIEI